MKIDIVTKDIAIDSKTIMAVNRLDSKIHLENGTILTADSATIDEVISRLGQQCTPQKEA
jgi:hypothetical protein